MYLSLASNSQEKRPDLSGSTAMLNDTHGLLSTQAIAQWPFPDASKTNTWNVGRKTELSYSNFTSISMTLFPLLESFTNHLNIIHVYFFKKWSLLKPAKMLSYRTTVG